MQNAFDPMQNIFCNALLAVNLDDLISPLLTNIFSEKARATLCVLCELRALRTQTNISGCLLSNRRLTNMIGVIIIFPLLITSCVGFGSSPTPIGKFTHKISIAAANRRPASSIPMQNSNSFQHISHIIHRQKSTKLLSAAIEHSDGDGRPAWALPWMPTWLITLRPRTQFLVGLCLYIFHLRILTQHGIAFPFQLIPNDEGWFQSIGLDSLAGMLAFCGLVWLRRASLAHSSSSSEGDNAIAVPPIWSDPTEYEAPWRLRSKKKRKTKQTQETKRKCLLEEER